jgi:hypothetical protein
MKTLVPFKQSILKLVLFVSVTAFCVSAQAQSSTTELVFKNSHLLSGTALQDGAKYVFPGVTTGVDAVLTIVGRSNNNVVIDNIDITGIGWDKAFQPQISRNGTVAANSNYWIEFDITFYDAGYTTASHKVQLQNITATGLDIDGDNGSFREFAQMNEITSFSTAANTSLQSVLLATLPINSYSGKIEYNYKFLGTTQDHPGIDTTDASIMATYNYEYKKTITFRIGGATGNSSVSSPSRMNSIWFKHFSLSTLPVKLTSFTAALNNNKADLKWTTASEINVSHFVIEKSIDGTNFNDAGVVFAYGNAADKTNYSFSDNVNNIQSGIIYYRLCSVDMDGKSQYSEIRIIRTGKQPDNTISILTYPNPVVNEVRISIPNNWQSKKAIYEVLNANGQVSKKTETASSSQTETLNMSNLAPGFYVVRVSCEGQTAQQKIIKQ